MGIEIIEIDERYVNQLIDDKKRISENRNILFEIEDKDRCVEICEDKVEKEETVKVEDEDVNENIIIYTEDNGLVETNNNSDDTDISPPETKYILITKYNLSKNYTHLSISLLDKNTIKHN